MNISPWKTTCSLSYIPSPANSPFPIPGALNQSTRTNLLAMQTYTQNLPAHTTLPHYHSHANRSVHSFLLLSHASIHSEQAKASKQTNTQATKFFCSLSKHFDEHEVSLLHLSCSKLCTTMIGVQYGVLACALMSNSWNKACIMRERFAKDSETSQLRLTYERTWVDRGDL